MTIKVRSRLKSNCFKHFNITTAGYSSNEVEGSESYSSLKNEFDHEYVFVSNLYDYYFK